MPAPTQPQDTQAIIVIVLFLVGLCFAYWRMVLRMIVIILITLFVLGVIAEMHLLNLILHRIG